MATTTPSDDRYDAVTITFHWLTALLVLALFGSSLMWKSGWGGLDRRLLESTHVSLGIGLALVLLARLVWRALAGRQLAAVGNRVSAPLSRLVHWALYGLLVLQTGLGFTLRWFQGEDFRFFGVFEIPQLIAANRGLAHTIENLHNLTAWTLIYLAGGHALMALAHRYVFKDDVLGRMLIGVRRAG